MGIKAILFDLDGTLLPMDQDKFIGQYFKDLAMYMYEKRGHEPGEYSKAIWTGVGAMLGNNGKVTNEEAYFSAISDIYGQESAELDYPYYDSFYREKYGDLKIHTWYTEKSSNMISCLKSKGFRVALATNPVFPSFATNMRIGWVGLKWEDFELVTTCDNIGFSKPNKEYYLEIARRMNVEPRECLMVGNDASDDIPASLVGMDVFLLTDCLINKKNTDISSYPQGSFDDLLEYIEKSCH